MRGSRRGRKRGVGRPTNAAVEQEKIEEAKRILESHRDQLSEWRKISRKEKSRILSLYFRQNERMACLSSTCTAQLSTHQGMLYHLDHCSLTPEEITVPCKLCGSRIAAADVKNHVCTGTSADRSPVRKRKRKALLKATKMMKQSRGESDSSESEATASASDSAFSESTDGTDDNRSVSFSGEEPPTTSVPNRNANTPSRETSSEQLQPERLFYHVKAFYFSRKRHHVQRLFPELICPSEWSTATNFFTESAQNSLIERSFPYQLTNGGPWFTLDLFGALTNNSYCIGFCGGRIVALAWCPSGCSEAQYVLVSIHLDRGFTLQSGAGLGFFQLWMFQPSPTTSQVPPRLEIVWIMQHNFGLVADIKWCPSGIFDEESSGKRLPRLGCFAAATSIGEVVLYCVPKHSTWGNVRADVAKKTCPLFGAGSIFPCLTLLTGTDTRILSIDWCPMNSHEKIAAGLESGYVLIWRLVHTKNWNNGEKIRPDLARFASLAPVRTVGWYTDIILFAFTMNGDVVEIDTVTGKRLRSISFVNLDSILVSPLFPGFHISMMLLCPTTSMYPSFVQECTHPTGIRCAKHKESVCSMALLPSKMCVVCGDYAGRLCAFRVRFILPGKKLSHHLTGNDCRVIFDTVVKEADQPIVNTAGNKCGNVGFLFYPTGKSTSPIPYKTRKYKLHVARHDYLAGLFGIACGINTNAADWICFGGESGHLHFMDLSSQKIG
ncbi:General transcription factor 3C polypeptide 2 [Trichuris trichiura]|uniref:General transcription factor 3C polypeptide 2 n=1 Tax=Trichuris trichiura TaxID=36087 RepID=A0A077Z2M9_TRITR|nr:General transcription factor 3C polypeptide 2 [Trichuris trichiura]